MAGEQTRKSVHSPLVGAFTLNSRVLSLTGLVPTCLAFTWPFGRGPWLPDREARWRKTYTLYVDIIDLAWSPDVRNIFCSVAIAELLILLFCLNRIRRLRDQEV